MGDDSGFDPRIEVLLETLDAIASCRRSDIDIRNTARAWDFAIRAHLVSKCGRDFSVDEIFAELNSFCDDIGPSPELTCLLKLNCANAFGLTTTQLTQEHQSLAKEVIWSALQTARHFMHPTQPKLAITA